MRTKTNITNDLPLHLGSSCILQANIYISRQFMHITDEYIDVWNSNILQANISISSQFMPIMGEYVYIYIEFILIAGECLYI